MKFTGPIYRPPYEADSLLLQVTVGCAHNKCNYCTMYQDVRFSTETLEQIETDLIEAKQIHGEGVKRVFLVNGDAFVLSANKLKKIANMIIEYFPQVETISMYAHVNNVKSKTDEELKELQGLRINQLWMGLESGNDATLNYFKKGITIKDSYTQLNRLNQAGIQFIGIFMFGTGGKNHGLEQAKYAADLINATKPFGIATTTLGAFGGSELAQDVANGSFIPATEREVLEEQKELMRLIEVDTLYLGVHAINTVSYDARLPQDRQAAINHINEKIEKLDNDYLDSIPYRNSI